MQFICCDSRNQTFEYADSYTWKVIICSHPVWKSMSIHEDLLWKIPNKMHQINNFVMLFKKLQYTPTLEPTRDDYYSNNVLKILSYGIQISKYSYARPIDLDRTTLIFDRHFWCRFTNFIQLSKGTTNYIELPSHLSQSFTCNLHNIYFGIDLN